MSTNETICKDCNGTGQARCYSCTGGWIRSPNGLMVCTTCGGTRYFKCLTCRGTGSLGVKGGTGEKKHDFTCTVCKGTGRSSKCWKCNGSGTLYGDYGISGICDACYGRGHEVCYHCGGRGVKY